MDTRLLNRARTRNRVLSESSATENDGETSGETQQISFQEWLDTKQDQTINKASALSIGKELRLKDEQKKTATLLSQRNRTQLPSKANRRSSSLERLSSEKHESLFHRKHKQRSRLLEELGRAKEGKKDSRPTSIGKEKDKMHFQDTPKREQNTTSLSSLAKQQRRPVFGNTSIKEHEKITNLHIPEKKERRFSLGTFVGQNKRSSSTLSIPQVKERRYSLCGPPAKIDDAASMSSSGDTGKRKCSSVGSSEAFKTWLHRKDEEALEREIQLLSQAISKKLIKNRNEILAQLKMGSKTEIQKK